MSHMQFEFDLNESRMKGPPSARWLAASPSRARMDLFVGLQPTDAASQRATDIADDFRRRLGVREAVRPPHVTLCALGWRSKFSALDLAAKKEELSSIDVEPFTVTFDQVMSFGGHRDKTALVLCCSQPNADLLELRRKIAEAQRQPGIEDERLQAFTPHMTLFYTRCLVLRQRLEVKVEWRVRDFHILWSHVGECRHESLWHWPPSA